MGGFSSDNLAAGDGIGINLYDSDSTIGSGRIATITDTLTYKDGNIFHEVDGFGETPTDGYVLINTTAAALGAQQFAPRTRYRGFGWSTGSGASQPVDGTIGLRPIQGTTNPVGSLVFATQTNNLGYQRLLQINSDPTIAGYTNFHAGDVTPSSTNYTWQQKNDGSEIWFNVANTGLQVLSFGANNSTDMALRNKNFSIGNGFAGVTSRLYIKGAGNGTGSSFKTVSSTNAVRTEQLDNGNFGINGGTITKTLNVNGQVKFGNAAVSELYLNNTSSGSIFSIRDENAGFNNVQITLGTTGGLSKMNTDGAAWTTNKNWRFDTTGVRANLYVNNGGNGIMINGTNSSTGDIKIDDNGNTGFFRQATVARPTTGIAAAAFVANTSGIANNTATYGGYTGGQIAQALINLGLLT